MSMFGSAPAVLSSPEQSVEMTPLPSQHELFSTPGETWLMQAVATPLGWIAVAADSTGVWAVSLGHLTRDEAIEALKVSLGHIGRSNTGRDDSRVSGLLASSGAALDLDSLIQRLSDYASGVPDDFRDVPVHRPDLTPFGVRVMEQLRRVGYGETLSYGELARRAGSPGAARAVGQVMANNRTPLILACHRVLGSGGRLGGFTSPQGIGLKRRLLRLESRDPSGKE